MKQINRLSINKFNDTDKTKTRLLAVMVCFVIAFSLLIYQLVDLVVFGENSGRNIALFNEENIPHRLEIVDRNNELLAVNLSTTSIYANPKKIIDPLDAAYKIKQLFPELEYEKLLSNFKSRKSFVWVKRNLTPKETLQVNNLGIPGIYFQNSERRVYPHGSLFSHVLGYVGIDGNGIAGIERMFDRELLYPQKIKDKLQLSLDVRVQAILHEELSNAIKKFNAIGGVGIITNVNNGEIIALVSLPDFDPHKPGIAKAEQLFNKATLGVYEMGSTYKTFTMAMGLESKKVKLNDVYDVHKPIKVARFTINDFSKKGNLLSVPEIFMYSSNIGTAKIVNEVGRQDQRKFLEKLGQLSELEVELPEKAKPLYPNEKNWTDISSITISYGHGIAVTPLHLVKGFAATVNGGYLYPITLLKRSNNEKIIVEKIFSKNTIIDMKKLLRLVVEHGTGKKANVDGYLVGGKTGTANKASKGGYNKHERMSSFTAVFPLNDPQYAIIAMLDEPHATAETAGFATGGMVVAPLVGEVIKRMAPLYGIKPIDKDHEHVNNMLHVEYKTGLNDETL